MPSTAKIILVSIAFYLVVGIYNFSGSGTFITPYFLNYFLLIAISIYGFSVNIKEQCSYILICYAIGLTAIASSHSLTLTLLNKWIGFSNYTTISSTDIHKLIAIIIFYGILFYIHIKAVQHHKTSLWFWLPLLFLLGSLVAVFINNGLWQAILLSIYMISFVLSSNKLNVQDLQVYRVLILQYVLFLVIENIRIITTGVN